MKETYNYEASEGMILLAVPADLRQLDYASAADMAVIEQAVIAGDDKPDLTPRAFNAEFKEYAEITLEKGEEVYKSWQEAHFFLRFPYALQASVFRVLLLVLLEHPFAP